MKSSEVCCKNWKNNEGDFCIYFPNRNELWWGYSFTKTAHEVDFIVSCDGDDAESFARLCLKEAIPDDFEYSPVTYEEYVEACENGDLYSLLCEYFGDLILVSDPHEKTVQRRLLTTLLNN